MPPERLEERISPVNNPVPRWLRIQPLGTTIDPARVPGTFNEVLPPMSLTILSTYNRKHGDTGIIKDD